MAKIIGVRFRNNGKIYYFDSGRYYIKEGSGVIVETSQGVEFAEVVQATREAADSEIVAPLKEILRIATPKDVQQAQQNRAKEKEAMELATAKINEHGLDMKLIRVEYTFDGAKIVFYFTSEGRVDFRDLVKDLAASFKTRIELRQIGARDEAKMLGGLGPCGLPCCCNQFLSDFQPVSIKMAKEQGLSLNPTKISGLCGRLMCCLKYEQHHYEQTMKLLPKLGTEVRCRDGVGKVCELNMLRERVKVKFNLPDDTVDIREYYYKELVPADSNAPIPEAPVTESEAPAFDILPGESIKRASAPSFKESADRSDVREGKESKDKNRHNKNKHHHKPADKNGSEAISEEPKNTDRSDAPANKKSAPKSDRPKNESHGNRPKPANSEDKNKDRKDNRQGAQAHQERNNNNNNNNINNNNANNAQNGNSAQENPNRNKKRFHKRRYHKPNPAPAKEGSDK